MLKLTVDQVLECIAALTPEEKAELQAKLSNISKATTVSNTPQSEQTQSFGDISISGGGNAFAATQAGGNVNQSQSGSQASVQNVDVQEALRLVEKLRQDIRRSDVLNPVEKATAEVPLNLVETELKKSQPDKNLVNQALSSLQSVLGGVKTLIGPVLEIAAVIAKKFGGMP